MSDSKWKVDASKKVPNTPWWRTAAAPFAPTSEGTWLEKGTLPSFGAYQDPTPSTWIGLSLFRQALEGGPPLQLNRWEGNLVVPHESILETVPRVLGGRLVRVEHRGNQNGTFLFSSEVMMVYVHFAEQGRYTIIQIATNDSGLLSKANQLFSRCVAQDDPQKGVVFTLAHGMGGYSLNRLGVAGTPLERENYNPEVLSGYDHVVADLNTESPCGRLVILSGEPGSGKTYLVRALLSQVSKAAYVLVPSHLVGDLSGPEILPALTAAKSEFNGPIVLIIEDADRVLVNRKEGDMDAISAMLNLGDGILGAVLDVRILATTNAETLEMDPATQRPGRLCQHIRVGALSPLEANKAFQRLTGKQVNFRQPTTLAEVYKLARKFGWAPPPKESSYPNLRKELL